MPRICPQCGTANRDTARFCINCAAPVVSEILCPACRTPNPPAARFCLHCAAPLRGATPPTGMLLPAAWARSTRCWTRGWAASCWR